MKKWTVDKAIETLAKIENYKVKSPSEDATNIMRMMFVLLTIKGEIVYNSDSRQIWEDLQGNLAFIDRTRKEAGVFYAGEKWVLDKVG